MGAVPDIEAGSTEKSPKVEDPSYSPENSIDIEDGFIARLQRFTGKYGVEQRGIERVLEHERTDTNVIKLGTMWFSVNMVVSSFAIGILGVPVFGLGFVDGFLVILFFNILGSLPVCFFSTLGARLGLRQMVLSRYYFGYYGVKLAVSLTALACLGWSCVNIIVGAQLIHAVNNDVPGWAGILIIGAATYLVTLFGYKIVHIYESCSWVPCFIVFLIVLGTYAHSGKFDNIPLNTGPTEAGRVLSFASAVFGFSTGWTTMSADYCVYQPVTTSRKKVFFTVFSGLLPSLIFTQSLGLAIATATVNDPVYALAYHDNHVGGLLAQVLVPPLGGFGKFCLVILALSIVGNNSPNIYSLGFSLQILHEKTAKLPRYVWSFFGSLIYIGVAVPGYTHFEPVLENFMLIIGYWLSIYEGISFGEHIIFRRGTGGYCLEDYDQPSKLPPGFAAVAAFFFGVAGVIVGMSQTWFVGPIARKIGESGGDVGFELAFSFTLLSYVVLRTLEKRYFKR
ncbi:hypothetical protein FQN55_001912 [Onygenales sp. PD_40]|nr:hypothetical protein FQN55_001912 [Onygenales sp. PD_40]KAK2776611.1 hypothetical protein FQN53_002554 [Emmonsiellopsis sp. PD_33]